MSLLRAIQGILLSTLVILALSQTVLSNHYTHPIHCKRWENGCEQYKVHCSKNSEDHLLRSCCEPLLSNAPDLSEFKSGVYSIKTGGFSSSHAWCDMTTDGGGWLVIVRRSSDEVDFDLLLEEYEDGFGNIEGDFWFGLRSLQALTSRRSYEMRLDMYHQPNDTESSVYAHYSSFNVSNPNYTLRIGNFSGSNENLTNSLNQFNERPFSARKTKIDTSSICSTMLKAGWWFTEDHCVAKERQTPGTILTQPYHRLDWYNTSNILTFGKYELKIRPTECSTASRSRT